MQPELLPSSLPNFQLALMEVFKDNTRRKSFVEMSKDDLLELAAYLVKNDTYMLNAIYSRALRMMGTSNDFAHIQEAIFYLLYTCWRKCDYKETGKLLPVRSSGLSYLDSTVSHFTVVIASMSAATPDLLHAAKSIFGIRPTIIYGEEDSGLEYTSILRDTAIELHSSSRSIGRSLLRLLRNQGVFCTFCDFVYAGHSSTHGKLFGNERPFSRAFLNLCMRDNAQLLPVEISYESGETVVSILEPLELEILGANIERSVKDKLTCQFVANLLEEVIRRHPTRWLLASTLVAEVERQVRR